MPAAVSVPNTFTAATTIQSALVNANYAALVAWINTNAVPLDGTKAMTGTLAGPAGVDPTTADQYSRKQYVDTRTQRTGATVAFAGATAIGASATLVVSWTSFTLNVTGWTTPSGTNITVPAGFSGLYLIGLYTKTYSTTSSAVAKINGTSIGNLTNSLIGTVAFLNAGDIVTVEVTDTSGAGGTLSAASLSIFRVSL